MKREDEVEKHQWGSKPTIEKKQKSVSNIVKRHATSQGARVNKSRRLDRDYENVAGKSPIRVRHEQDLFGNKCGVSQFNPILVENHNKIVHEDDYEDPEMLRKMGYS